MGRLKIMRKNRLIAVASFSLLMGIAVQASAQVPIPELPTNFAPIDYARACLEGANPDAGVTTRIYRSHAEIDTSVGYVEGLPNWFCIFETEQRIGMIDLATLGSTHPSIAATYLLYGIDLEAMGDPPPDVVNPGTWVCENLAGTSITRVTSGGFVNDFGQDEICVFGDGSKISIWVLVYVSLDEPDAPNYLWMRYAVKSLPLELQLPYLGNLPLG